MNTELPIPINTVLYTKDGRNVGNAFIVAHEKGRYVVKTDYGAYAHFTPEKVEALFYLDKGYSEEERLERAKSHKNYRAHGRRKESPEEVAPAKEDIIERVAPVILVKEEPVKKKRARIAAKPVKVN